MSAVGGAGALAARLGEASSDFRWPGEWERHERTVMAMPFRWPLYGKRLPDCQAEWAAVARAIADFEPVTMIVPKGSRRRMRTLIGGGVELWESDYDDGWTRDSGPVVLADGRRRRGLDWGFNGWGGAWDRFWSDWTADDALPPKVCRRLGFEAETMPMILEGGSVLSDGHGTILTTEECLLNPNRNPSMSKAEIEAELLARLRARKVIWLPYGLLGDLTSGHVDGVAMFIGRRRVLAQVDREDAAESARLQANLEVLRAETDADGHPLEIETFPFLPRSRFAGGPRVSHAYINFAFVNGGLVVPTAGLKGEDARALRRLRRVFPHRRVVGVPTPNMTWAGGGVHCITQQIPRGGAR